MPKAKRTSRSNSAPKGPPRPCNGFIIYRTEQGRKLDPNLIFSERSRVLGTQWRAEPEEVREKYRQLAQIAAEEHKEQYPDYRFRPRKAKKKGKEDEEESVARSWSTQPPSARSGTSNHVRDDSPRTSLPYPLFFGIPSAPVPATAPSPASSAGAVQFATCARTMGSSPPASDVTSEYDGAMGDTCIQPVFMHVNGHAGHVYSLRDEPGPEVFRIIASLWEQWQQHGCSFDQFSAYIYSQVELLKSNLNATPIPRVSPTPADILNDYWSTVGAELQQAPEIPAPTQPDVVNANHMSFAFESERFFSDYCGSCAEWDNDET